MGQQYSYGGPGQVVIPATAGGCGSAYDLWLPPQLAPYVTPLEWHTLVTELNLIDQERSQMCLSVFGGTCITIFRL